MRTFIIIRNEYDRYERLKPTYAYIKAETFNEMITKTGRLWGFFLNPNDPGDMEEIKDGGINYLTSDEESLIRGIDECNGDGCDYFQILEIKEDGLHMLVD